MRVHGTTRCHPAEVFAASSTQLKPLPDEVFDIRPGPIPRSPQTGTSRSPRRSTAFLASWSGGAWMLVSTPTR